jgi:hypothetical protein
LPGIKRGRNLGKGTFHFPRIRGQATGKKESKNEQKNKKSIFLAHKKIIPKNVSLFEFLA